MMDDDFYNDSIGDQILLELNITNFTPTVTDKNKEITGSTENEINSVNDKLHSLITTPDQFIDFPYPKPYSQQLELMQTVYKTLESNCCGIFESPTGTGKSLSLLTATLRWLLDYNEKQIILLNSLQSQLKLMNHENKENNSKEYDWIMEYDKNRLLKQQIEPQIEDLLIYQSNLQLIEKIKSSSTSSSSLPFKHQTDFSNVDEMTLTEANSENIDIDQLKNIIDISNDQYDCDDELFLCKPDENLFDKHKISELDEIELDQQFESQQQSDNGLLRIIYCSRTHSQLGQVAKEFAKCKTLFNKVTIIQLSSRHLLCTNETIFQLKHPDLINIACLELNRSRNREQGESKSFRCPMRNSTAVNNLSKHLLIGNSALNITSTIRDRKSSKSSKSTSVLSNSSKECQKDEKNLNDTQLSSHIGCPYYANRKGLPLAQLVLVPYSSLLQPSNRLTSGLKLKNSIVIIDEAHNLLEATASSMSVSLSLVNDLYKLEELFSGYLQYYRSRLSSVLALRLRQIKHFIQQLKVYLNTTLKHIQLSISSMSDNVIIKTVNKLFSESNLDNINLGEFIDCLEYQHFIMKLIGFSKWYNNNNNTQQNSKQLDNVSISQTTCSQMTNLLNSMKRKYSNANSQCGDISQVCISNKKSKIDIEKSEGIGSSLFKFHSFLQALEFCEEDARIIIEPVKNSTKLNLSTSSSDLSSSSSNLADDSQDLCLRVVFLNPGRYLKDLVQEARSVLLVGGTMQPFNEAIEQIFIPSGKLSNQIVTFTCDHVINAKKQLAVYPLGVHSHQSNGEVFSLDFTYQNRSNPHMIDACGEVILQICQQLPAGIVVFTPSYEYQSILHNRWEATGLLNKIEKYKSLFHEPKTTTHLDQVSGFLLIYIII
uniref:Putative chl1 helicase homolog n=1 Tax=Schistosoma mansoni TaxID=6183 RepID=A0A5K4F0X8_SCHMA